MHINTLNRVKTGDPRLIGLSQLNTTDSASGSPTTVTLRGIDGGTDEPNIIILIIKTHPISYLLISFTS